MSYFPPTGSTVAFQTDATKLAANVSVTGGFVNVIGSVSSAPLPASVSGVGLFNVNHTGNGSILANLQNSSVAVLQGTNPWVIGNSSVQVNNIATGNSSVQLISTSASIATQVNRILTGNSSVQVISGTGVIGSVAALQATNPWIVQLTSGSVITTGGNSSVQVVGTVPPSSVSGVGLFNVNHVGNGSILSTLTNSSVTALQGTNPWFVQLTSGSVITTVETGPSSVQLLGGSNSIGSVTALQGTNPWMVQLTSGSVITTGGNSSVQVVGLMPPQSVSGVGTFNVATVGSVLNQYREDVLGSSVVGVAMMFKRTDSASLMSAVSPNYPLPVQGSVTALQGTNPWVIGNNSVMLASGSNVVGSVTAYQGPARWVTATSITGGVSSVSQVGNWNMGPSSVQLMAGTNNAGSITAIQGTNPWVVGNSSVQVVGTMPPQSVSGVGLFNVNHTGNGSILVGVPGSVATVFQAASLISGHASTVNASSGSILVLASVQSTLYSYITDFQISNTGATTTLVTFSDRDGSVMGKTIAPAGGGSNQAGITSPMRTLVPGSPVYVGATNATSTLHAWVGGYRAL